MRLIISLRFWCLFYEIKQKNNFLEFIGVSLSLIYENYTGKMTLKPKKLYIVNFYPKSFNELLELLIVFVDESTRR